MSATRQGRAVSKQGAGGKHVARMLIVRTNCRQAELLGIGAAPAWLKLPRLLRRLALLIMYTLPCSTTGSHRSHCSREGRDRQGSWHQQGQDGGRAAWEFLNAGVHHDEGRLGLRRSKATTKCLIARHARAPGHSSTPHGSRPPQHPGGQTRRTCPRHGRWNTCDGGCIRRRVGTGWAGEERRRREQWLDSMAARRLEAWLAG